MTHKPQIPITKYCPKCEEDLPAGLFNRNKRAHDGLSSYCKDHERERCREHHKEHRERANDRQRAKYAAARKQPDLFTPDTRPADGPRCACGKVLYSYEVRKGKCLKCLHNDFVSYWNQPIKYSQERITA